MATLLSIRGPQVPPSKWMLFVGLFLLIFHFLHEWMLFGHLSIGQRHLCEWGIMRLRPLGCSASLTFVCYGPWIHGLLEPWSSGRPVTLEEEKEERSLGWVRILCKKGFSLPHSLVNSLDTIIFHYLPFPLFFPASILFSSPWNLCSLSLAIRILLSLRWVHLRSDSP